MAIARKTSSTLALLATVLLILSLVVSFADVSEACGCKGCSCTTKPTPATPTGGAGKCPVDTLKLGACTDVLGELVVNLNLGLQLGSRSPTSSSSEKKPCCELIGSLAGLDAAVCLCAALRADVLGVVGLDLPVQLTALANYCGKKLPAGFQCPNNN